MSKAAALTDETICKHIIDSVLEQRLAPGTKLTEESLCGIFGVSRNVIRRVFVLLSKDNIIHLVKNKGAVIASPTPEESHKIFEARIIMENALLEQTIKHATTSDIKAMRAHLIREQEALESDDLNLWIRLSGEFHIVLARAANNAPMCGFLEQLVFQSSLILALYGNQSAPSNCKGGEHERLVDAVEAKDLSTAQAIMAEHMAELEGLLKFDKQDTTQDLHAILTGRTATA